MVDVDTNAVPVSAYKSTFTTFWKYNMLARSYTRKDI